MADESKLGTDWRVDELDAIVADYFAMPAAHLAGQPYSKSEHNAGLIAQIGRTHGSIEYKHQNISAVLDKLGMTWIPGYKPMKNIQHAILGAIDRYLTTHADVLVALPASAPLAPPPGSVFVDPPTLTAAEEALPAALRRLVRKFDPVERDHRNRSLGKAGEEFVLDLERRQLAEADRADLARKVRWVAEEDGDGAGYDVLSFDVTGRERLLEVKTTNGSARTPFFLTRNERDLAAERPSTGVYTASTYSPRTPASSRLRRRWSGWSISGRILGARPSEQTGRSTLSGKFFYILSHGFGNNWCPISSRSRPI